MKDLKDHFQTDNNNDNINTQQIINAFQIGSISPNPTIKSECANAIYYMVTKNVIYKVLDLELKLTNE